MAEVALPDGRVGTSLLGVPLRVSPLNARRLANLKANRRGYVSLIVFLVLFGLSLAANLIANDKPVLVRYDACSAEAAAAGTDPVQASPCPRWYFPLFVDYPETEFGGFLPTPTDFTFDFVRQQINAHGWMLFPPIPSTYDTILRELPGPAPSPPCWLVERAPDQPSACSVSPNLLGTDDQGRDVLARVIYGFRISVLFGLALTLLSSLVGICMGAVQGYFGGWIDLGLQRFMEIWAGMPTLYLLIIMSSLIIPGFWSLLILMLLFSWMALVDLVRAEFLRARNFDFVRAARALGVSDWTIMRRHVLPNAMVSSLTFMPFILNGSITTLTSLDFLGFGLPVGSPSLGELLLQGKNNLHAPWLGLSGFFVIAIMLSLLVFVGEAVRDAFDPRKTFLAAAPPEPAPILLDETEVALDEPERADEPRAAAGGQS